MQAFKNFKKNFYAELDQQHKEQIQTLQNHHEMQRQWLQKSHQKQLQTMANTFRTFVF